MNRYRSTFRSFCRWAFETGRLRSNPGGRLQSARIESSPAVPITLTETRLLLATIRGSDDPLRFRDEVLFSAYAMTGLRRNEVLRLEESDYDQRDDTLRVRTGKGGRFRLIPVAPVLGRLLKQFLESQRSLGRHTTKIFPGRIPGRGLTPRQAQSRFEHWKALAGLRKQLVIHSFRAGFATALHERSADLPMVSHALGHRDVRPTLRYIHLSTAKVRNAVEALARAI